MGCAMKNTAAHILGLAENRIAKERFKFLLKSEGYRNKGVVLKSNCHIKEKLTQVHTSSS